MNKKKEIEKQKKEREKKKQRMDFGAPTTQQTKIHLVVAVFGRDE